MSATPGKVISAIAGVFTLLALLQSVACVAREEIKPIIFESTETPPFWSPSLPENGFGGALLKVVSVAAGVPYSIEYLPLKRFRKSPATYLVGDPDILESRKRHAIFPIGIFHSDFFYYKPHHGAINFRRLSELRGHTVGVLRGTLEDKDYFVSKGINLEESDSVESLLRKLKRGRVDFVIMVAAAGNYTINKLFPNEREKFDQFSIPGSLRPIAIMIDVSDPEGRAVAQRYRQVLDKALHSKAYQDVLENFYGKDKIPAGRLKHLKEFEQYYMTDWVN